MLRLARRHLVGAGENFRQKVVVFRQHRHAAIARIRTVGAVPVIDMLDRRALDDVGETLDVLAGSGAYRRCLAWRDAMGDQRHASVGKALADRIQRPHHP